MSLPDGYALVEDTPAGELREGVVYVTRGLAEARGWLPEQEGGEWWRDE
jgi:hypothetical protein